MLKLCACQRAQQLSYKLKKFHSKEKNVHPIFRTIRILFPKNGTMDKLSGRGQMHLINMTGSLLKSCI